MNFSLQQQWQSLQHQAHQVWQFRILHHYLALEASEQRIVRFAAITLPLIVFIFGILLPVLDNNRALHEEVVMLHQQVQEAKQLAHQLVSKPQQHKTSTRGNALTRVDQLARQTGVRTFMTKLRPQQVMAGKQRVQTQIKSAPYHNVVVFLAALEKAGFTVSQLKIQAASTGKVDMQAMVGT